MCVSLSFSHSFSLCVFGTFVSVCPRGSGPCSANRISPRRRRCLTRIHLFIQALLGKDPLLILMLACRRGVYKTPTAERLPIGAPVAYSTPALWQACGRKRNIRKFSACICSLATMHNSAPVVHTDCLKRTEAPPRTSVDPAWHSLSTWLLAAGNAIS